VSAILTELSKNFKAELKRTISLLKIEKSLDGLEEQKRTNFITEKLDL